jgi:hypothetical protein
MLGIYQTTIINNISILGYEPVLILLINPSLKAGVSQALPTKGFSPK